MIRNLRCDLTRILEQYIQDADITKSHEYLAWVFSVTNLLVRAVTFFRHFRLQFFRLDAVSKAAATFVESNRYDFGLISRYIGGEISFLFLQAMNAEANNQKSEE